MVFCVGVCGVCVSWIREEQQTCRVVREVNVRNTKCLRPACPGHFGTKQYRVYGVVIERRSAVYPQPTPAEPRLSVIKPLPIFIQGQSSLPRVSISLELAVLRWGMIKTSQCFTR